MSVIGFFPTPYPDEDFRSIVYRYHIHTGSGYFRNTNLELFNTNTSNHPHMPRNLNALFAKLPDEHGLSLDQILQDHTLWPIVRLFLLPEQIERCMQEFQNGVEGAKNFAVRYLSDRTGRILAANIRYCPICVDEDVSRYGECFVHRSHQIDPIDFCFIHHVSLITRCGVCDIGLSKNDGTGLLVSNDCSAGHKITRSLKKYNDNLAAKMQLHWEILSMMKYGKNMDRIEVLRRLQIALVAKGYTYLSGTIKGKELLHDITNSLNDTTTVQIATLIVSTPTSVRQMFYGRWHGWTLPLYVFMMQFFYGSVREFLTSSTSVAIPLPFGPGPWKCVNKICPDYSMGSIKRCERYSSLANTVSGTFTCPTCGCTYHKKWSSGMSDTERKPAISTIGWLWENRFIELINQGLNYKEIAKELDTSTSHILSWIDKFTDNRCKEATLTNGRLSEFIRAADELAATKEYKQDALMRRRETIFNIMTQYSGLSRRNIYSLVPSAYKWLLKNDCDWMEQTLPKRRYSATRLDWSLIDKKLQQTVRAVAEGIYIENPLKRISKKVIINACIDSDRVHFKIPEKVPLAWQALLDCEESKEQYMIRHTPVVVRQLLRSGCTNVTLNGILSLKPSYRGCSDNVRREIIRVLKGMGFQGVEYGMDRYL